MKNILLIMILYFQEQFICKSQPVQINGTINLSIQKGTIDCDFRVTNIPDIKNYYIFLNSGLNIRYFRDLDDNFNYYYNKRYNDTVPPESFGYYFPDKTGKAEFLPKGYEISYVGAFPVIADTIKADNFGDWNGNIAFNGKTIRASQQSHWYPVLYDIRKDIEYTKVAYNIYLTCSDCSAIYLNGSIPVKASSAHFKSDSAIELLIFAGTYKIDCENQTYFLNTDMTNDQLKEFGKMTDSYKKFYESNLSIPYKYNITYIQTTPISKHTGFLFVTYPSFTTVGWDNGFKNVFGEEGNWFKPFIAHELGHYYFGHYAIFNSEIGDIITESFTEFLSFKSTESLLGDSVYNAKINEDVKKLNDFNPVPISNIKFSADIKDRETYDYVYFPIELTAIEKEIGREKMWEWLRLILTTKAEFTNYEFLISTLRAALKDESKLNTIESRYFKSDESVKNAITEINNK